MTCQVHIYNPAQSNSSSDSIFLTYLPLFSFGFVILSFLIDRLVANQSKKKQIIREWYSKALLDPCLDNCNVFFKSVQELISTHVAIFEKKNTLLSDEEFLKYKAGINQQFERIKIKFYNESLLPVYQSYPEIANNANNVLLAIQDSYVDFFGGKKLDSNKYDQLLNDLYIQKGRILATLEAPLSGKEKAKLPVQE